MTKEQLLKKKQTLEVSRKQAEQSFHQLSGAIAIIDEQLAEFDKPEEKPKE